MKRKPRAKKKGRVPVKKTEATPKQSAVLAARKGTGTNRMAAMIDGVSKTVKKKSEYLGPGTTTAVDKKRRIFGADFTKYFNPNGKRKKSHPGPPPKRAPRGS